MSRTFTIAAILTVATLGPARAADGLAARVHAAAVKSCMAEAVESMPTFFYNTIDSTCVHRLESSAMRKYAAQAQWRMRASTAFNGPANN